MAQVAGLGLGVWLAKGWSRGLAWAVVSFPDPNPRAGKKGLAYFEPFLGFADSARHMTNQAWLSLGLNKRLLLARLWLTDVF